MTSLSSQRTFRHLSNSTSKYFQTAPQHLPGQSYPEVDPRTSHPCHQVGQSPNIRQYFFSFCLFFYLHLTFQSLSVNKGWRQKNGNFREDINRKKTFSFGHCPNDLNPPPPLNPIRAIWSFFSKEVKVSLELKILYILYRVIQKEC